MKKIILITMWFLLMTVISMNAATYYVNDNDTTGDRYCSVAGDDSKDGQTASTPKLTIANLMSTYPALGANDIIKIDTGVYNEQIKVTSANSGSTSGYLTFLGVASGGTNSVINGATIGGGYWGCIELNNVNYVKLDSLYVKYSGAQANTRGIMSIGNCSNLLIVNNWVVSNGAEGIRLRENSGSIIAFSTVSNNHCNNNDRDNQPWPAGILLNGGYRNKILKNECKNNGTISGNGHGISIENGAGSYSNTIRGNIISLNNANGLFLASPQNLASSNIIFNNAESGIYLNAAQNTVNSNNVHDNSQRGIFIDTGANTTTLIGNAVYNHPYPGISIWEHDNILINNWIYKNQGGEGGVDIAGGFAYNNFLAGNDIYSNSNNGIRFVNNTSINNLIFKNNIYNNNALGIDCQSPNNTFTSNQIFSNTAFGIRVDNIGKNIKIDGNNIYNNQNSGIALFRQHNSVSNNIIYANKYKGIEMNFEASNNLVMNNIIYNCQDGISLGNNITGNVLFKNTIYSCRQTGITSDGADFNYIISNSTYNTVTNSGISFGGNLNNNNLFIGNRSWKNHLAGINLVGEGDMLLNNICYSNGGWGMRLVGNNGAPITNEYNICYNNTWEGIVFDDAGAGSLVKNCTFFKNGAHGIQLNNSGSLLVKDCISVSNGYHGYFQGTGTVPPILTVSYSLAYGNGNGPLNITTTNNILIADPKQVSTTPVNPNFLRLSGYSPAINAGDPADTPPAGSGGGSRIDMGAYEYRLPLSPPVITGLSTNQITPGGSVTLYGNNFQATQFLSTIKISNRIDGIKTAPAYGTWNNTSVTFTVPADLQFYTTNTIFITTWGGSDVTNMALVLKDFTPPYFTNLNPANGQIGVQTNANIVFKIKDNLAFTSDTVKVTVAGILALTNNIFQAGNGFAGSIVADGVLGYTVTVDKLTPFSEDSNISVTLYGRDAGGISTNYTYSFTTTNLSGPVLSGVAPLNGATQVATNTNIIFFITDNKAVNSNSIFVKIGFNGTTNSAISNGKFINGYNGPTSKISNANTGKSYKVIVDYGSPYPANSAIHAFITGKDNSGSSISTNFTFNTVDLMAPTFTNFNPTNSSGVPLTSKIYFEVNDNIAVASNLLSASINQISALSNGSFKHSYTGNIVRHITGFHVTINPPALLTVNTSYTTRMKASDGAGNIGSNMFTFLTTADATLPVTTASPKGGAFFSKQLVTLTATDNGGTNGLIVFYTTNLSTPTTNSPSAHVTKTFLIQKDTVLKFRARDKTGNLEDVQTEKYTFLQKPNGDVAVYPNYINISKSDKDMKIVFAVADTAEINIYNMKGDLVRKFDKKSYLANSIESWDGKSDSGQKVGSGMYIAHVKGSAINVKLNILIVK